MGLISRDSSRTYRYNKHTPRHTQVHSDHTVIMEFVFGLVGKDFTLLAADGNAARSVICYQQNHDRIVELNKYNALTMSGDPGDVEQFSEYIKANMQLYAMRNNYETTPAETANFTRREIATALRKRGMYQCGMMMGGYDTMAEKPSLFYMGAYGSCVEVPFAAHGYGAMFAHSLLDRHYRPDLSYDQATDLVQKVCQELARRFVINLPEFKIKKIDKNGVVDCGFMSYDNTYTLKEDSMVSTKVGS